MSAYDAMNFAEQMDPRLAFRCARLNLRGGKRQLLQGHTRKGMIALYDSVLFGMCYYITRHKQCASVIEDITLWDAASLFQALVSAGVFDDPLTFNRFCITVERVLWQPSVAFDVDATLAQVERMLVKLGVVPSSESG